MSNYYFSILVPCYPPATRSAIQIRSRLGELKTISSDLVEHDPRLNCNVQRVLFAGNQRKVQPPTRRSSTPTATRRRFTSRQKVAVAPLLSLKSALLRFMIL